MLSNSQINTRRLLSDAKFYDAYSRWDDVKNRYETWNESVDRVMNMHKTKYADKLTDELVNLIDEASAAYKDKLVLGAQRALQFGGEQILRNNFKLYNCSSTYIDRSRVFGEIFWALLSGAGVGFSVQKHHIAKLPEITERKKQAKAFVVEDSIEGWADALSVLMSSYFVGGGDHPEYEGRKVYFDLSKVRPLGAMISGGFKAPGPEPLRKALDKIEYLLQGLVLKGVKKLEPIHAYDIIMHASDAVLSGGVRRSATICLFSLDDEAMMTAKTGNWYSENPQRARSNNSVVLVRSTVTFEQFSYVMSRTREFGEPGFAFFDSTEFATNPCFTGDTVVAVADGRNGVTIKELAELGERFDVWSAKDVAPYSNGWHRQVRSAVAFKTGTRNVITVHLTNGDSFRCTPDHKLAVPYGHYVEAKDSLNRRVIGIHDGLEHIFVESIEDLGEVEDVYDLTVEDNHNFYIHTGEDGILVHNCFEIGMYPVDISTGESGFELCNLCEINGGAMKSKEIFFEACRAAAIIGTLQAGYTYFPYMTEATKNIVEREALLGVSITGWMNSPDVLFDEETLKQGAEIVKATNALVAKIIGINPAARSTCVKPSGTASILLMTESGIHGEHAPRYLRNAQMNKESEVANLIRAENPYMVEDSVWSANKTDYVVSFPIIAPEGAIFKESLLGVNLLEKVKLVQNSWVEYGTNIAACVDPRVRHNVSNTVTVRPDDWDLVTEYVFENRNSFAGISFLAASGDKDYAQAPFTSVLTEQELLDNYGPGAIFASGLIVDGMKVFSDLWKAFEKARDTSQERLDNQNDWIRRYVKFAENYFEGDLKKAEYCLKDVSLVHKWNKIQQNYRDVDFVSQLTEKRFVDADSLAAAACAGAEGCNLF